MRHFYHFKHQQQNVSAPYTSTVREQQHSPVSVSLCIRKHICHTHMTVRLETVSVCRVCRVAHNDHSAAQMRETFDRIPN